MDVDQVLADPNQEDILIGFLGLDQDQEFNPNDDELLRHPDVGCSSSSARENNPVTPSSSGK